MYFRIPPLIFLLAIAAPIDANILTRSTESFVRMANIAHRHAVKRSSGLARDLRRAFGSILVEPANNNQKVYCVSAPSNSAGGLTSSSNNTEGGSSSASESSSGSSARPSGTASSSSTSSAASSTPSSSSGNAASSSPWKLAQSYVSVIASKVCGEES